MEPLRDSWGREIKSVRVSVTDKCNFRCTYCMPAEGLQWLGRQEILSFEEISRLVGVLARLGVDEVRLTGGEPLVRRDLPVLVGMLSAIDGVRDLSLTTNGVLLDRLAGPLVEAGLQRLNVSLDSLNHVRFAEITRRDARRRRVPARGRPQVVRRAPGSTRARPDRNQATQVLLREWESRTARRPPPKGATSVARLVGRDGRKGCKNKRHEVNLLRPGTGTRSG
jgi:hypothetical protein